MQHNMGQTKVAKGISPPKHMITIARAAIRPPNAISFVELRFILAILLQQTILNIPQLLRKVHIIGVRIIKALHFVPQCIHLLQAVGTDLFQTGAMIDKLAISENGDLQFLRGEIIDGLGFPSGIGIENDHILAVVHNFIINTQIVRNSLSRVVTKEAVDLLVVRVRDLAHVFRNFDLRLYIALGILDRYQFVHAAEDRFGSGGDQPLANAEHVNLRTLAEDILDDMLIQRVGNRDLAVGPAGFVQHLSCLAGEVCHVTGVKSDATLGQTLGLKHLVKDPNGIGNTGMEGVIGIHQQGGIVGIQLTPNSGSDTVQAVPWQPPI